MAKKKISEKDKLKKAIEKWTEEKCAAVLRYVELIDYPPKPSRKKPRELDDFDDNDEDEDEP